METPVGQVTTPSPIQQEAEEAWGALCDRAYKELWTRRQAVEAGAIWAAESRDRKPMSGSQRRVIEAVVERVLAGEGAKQVAEDYPDEYGYGPVLDNLERAIDSRDQRIKELEAWQAEAREVLEECAHAGNIGAGDEYPRCCLCGSYSARHELDCALAALLVEKEKG